MVSKKTWTATVMVLMLVVALAGPASAKTLLSWPTIKIINLDPNVEIKVWSYEDGQKNLAFSCQTLGWSSDRVREIEPWAEPNEINHIFNDYCGNYNKLFFYFSVWNRNTGDYYDITTRAQPAPWGAIWTWDGRQWSCSGCD